MLKTIYSPLFLLSAASAAYSGFNLDAQLPDGQCKQPADWSQDFAAIRSWASPDMGELAVRVFASSDCGTIYNIAQPAIDAGIKVLAGVWAFEGNGHFDREKNALNDVISEQGCDWLAAVSVGSEDLYREDIPASRLAEQIHDVRGMVRQHGGTCSTIPVTHTDTWTAWVNGANAPVIEASDVIISNAFPYWQGSDITEAAQTFANALSAAEGVSQGKPVWTGETGWPTAGDTEGAAVPSTANLQRYWREVQCSGGILFGKDSFWFSAFDHATRSDGVEQNFGVATSSRQLKISLNC